MLWEVAWALILGFTLSGIVSGVDSADGLFSVAGLIPTHRPSIDSTASRGITWNYTTALDIFFLLVAAGLFALTLRRVAKDPICGMTVDRFRPPHRSVLDGRVFYFCGAGRKRRFEEGAHEH